MEQHEKITTAEYQATANSFREGTWNHDVSQNRDRLVKNLPRNPGKILDIGCGPGRDLVAFSRQGHTAIGLDGTPAFVVMAKEASGCEVWHQSFESLDLPTESFDGIFANASLIHVPRQEMLGVLRELKRSLVPKGAILMSMARGTYEGYIARQQGYRYLTEWEYETLEPVLIEAGFDIIEHYYRPPGLPCNEQPWLVMVGRKQ